MEMNLHFDHQIFSSRLMLLQNALQNNQNFKDVCAIAFIAGNNEILTYNKTSALQEWLFGFEFQDTFTCVTKTHAFIVTGKKKADFLEPVKKSGLNVEIIVRNREESNSSRFEETMRGADFDTSRTDITLGIFEKDRFGGPFAESWYRFLEESKFKKFDLSYACAKLLAVKDQAELSTVKVSAAICSDLYTHFVKSKILDIIDDEKKIRHSSLSQEIENALDNEKYRPKGALSRDIEACFPPIVQSGGKYNLKFSTSSENTNMTFDCIVTFIGVRYKYYCSSLVRTLMVQPSDDLKKLYSFTLSLYDLAICTLKPETKFCNVYKTVLDSVKSSYPQYVENFTRSIGFVTGLEFRENSMIIDSKNINQIEKGMVFTVLIGFQNVKVAGHNEPMCVAVGDTVVIDNDGTGVTYTTSKKNLGSSCVILNETLNNSVEFITEEVLKNAPVIMKTKKRQPQKETLLNEEQRKTHQAELKVRLNEDARRRLVENDDLGTKKHISSSKIFVGSYKSPLNLPHEIDTLNLKIYVDKRAESVIIPICGMSVPFHISTIKSVSSNVEGKHTYLRINFNVITGPNSKLEDLSSTYGKNVYVKEMIFRSLNIKASHESAPKSSNLVASFNQIKDLHKNFKSRVQEESEMEGVVKQAELIINPSKTVPRIKDLVIRPQIGTRRSLGVLEAHINGFRYTSSKGERIDVLYQNIKHAFFQPCDHESVITVHFHLLCPIMIGKKKFKDVQFFSEIGEVVTDLSKNNSNMLDREEIEAEENERESRNKLKMVFKSFVERVETITNNEFEFEIPFRELGFYGVPFKTTCLLVPTTYCLINIIEQPPFVVTLDEIELVHFERVSFHMKNFDIVIIFKDYNKKVCNISTVSMGHLESIKDWLNSCDIKFTESTQNLNWAKIMKTILDEPEEFFASGGWTFLDPESDEDAVVVDPEEQDEEYVPESSLDEGTERSETDSEQYESEKSESGSASEDDSESGKSWSVMEEEARALDAMMHGESPNHKRKISMTESNTKRKRF